MTATCIFTATSAERAKAHHKRTGKKELKEKTGFPSLYLVSRITGSRSWRYFYQHPQTKKMTQRVLGPGSISPRPTMSRRWASQ